MEWFTNLFSKNKKPASIAKDRLKIVLMHDRVNCDTDLLEMIKNDILMVLSKYVDIDTNELDIQMSQAAGDSNNPVPVLYANIPIKKMRKMNKDEKS